MPRKKQPPQPTSNNGYAVALRRIANAGATKAERLDLSGLELESLPPEVGGLTALRSLDLSDNQLTSVPPEVGRLAALTSLDLGGNQLTSLPPEVGRLTALTKLGLYRNQLTSLPQELGQLTDLMLLNLGGNQLTSLPPEVARLTALRSMYLGVNQLTSLPPEVGLLTALTSLDLSSNQFTSLIPEVGRLTALTSLELGSNQLTSLTPEVGLLTALRSLDLGHNRLTSLPPEMCRLTDLTFLNLIGNQLTSLPPEINRLDKLRLLNVHGNERLGIPPEVLGESTWEEDKAAKPAEILAYYFARLSGPKRRLNEAKLLIVGEGEVGKSSLVERLLANTFKPGMAKTEGIGRKIWNVDRKPGDMPEDTSPDASDDKPIRVNVWDFGGQEVMHATHQFFLTRRSLYVVVLAGRGGENQGRLDYWLRAVQSYGGTSPILVVANKCEEHKLEINVNGLKRDYAPNPIEFFQVSCKSGHGIPELKRQLEDLVAGLENVNDEVPERFFTVKEELEQAAREKNYLERSEYDAICSQHTLNDVTERDLLLRFLHELGTVLNFHDPDSPYNLRDTHILNPEWVTEGVYDVLNNASLMRKGGTFKANDLGRILKHPERYPEPKRPFIVDMMRKFEIAVDIPGQPGTLLVPELLTVNEPDLNWDEGAALNFEYGYTILPSGLVPRFIVRMIGSTTTKWRTGAVLEHDGCKALVRGDVAGNRVRVSVLGPVARRRMALAAIRAQFREIHATVPGFKPEERVPLPEEPHLSVEYEHLLRLEDEGVADLLPPKAKRKYTVEELLNGIETPDARAEYRRKQLEHRQQQERRMVSKRDPLPAPPPVPPPVPPPQPPFWRSLIAPGVVALAAVVLAILGRSNWKGWATMSYAVFVVVFGAVWVVTHRYEWRSKHWPKYVMFGFAALAGGGLLASSIGLKGKLQITPDFQVEINTTTSWIATVVSSLGAVAFALLEYKREQRQSSADNTQAG